MVTKEDCIGYVCTVGFAALVVGFVVGAMASYSGGKTAGKEEAAVELRSFQNAYAAEREALQRAGFKFIDETTNGSTQKFVECPCPKKHAL